MGSSSKKTATNERRTSDFSQNQSSSSSQGSQGTNRTVFDPRTAAEQDILNQYTGLGNEQTNFLNQLMSGTNSPYTMNQADQDLVNKSFDAANQRLMVGGKDYADYLATTRGLNKSDTPVSQQAMERFGLGLSDLESARARAALDYGLQGTQMRLMGAQALPAGLGAAFLPMFNERMAGGQQQYSSSGYQNTSGQASGHDSMSGHSDTVQRDNPSIMSQIGQGLQLAAGAGLMAGGAIMGNPMMAMGGMGMLGGGGGNPFMTGIGSMTSGGGGGSLFGGGGGLSSAQKYNSDFYDPRYGIGGK